ncbi:unnamed protein product [Symbiodinium natans]|uniref:Uncharacterized protein n=1 Tax=Symbiodinium natans TaxID=878477 RepID=A0A812ST43_9DINO|nr:unnamed protein product [Symbiodinium natans]
MDGTRSSFKIPEPLPVRVVIFYHTVDAPADFVKELQRWVQLAGEGECCGKIVLCNTESVAKTISVSAKIELHNACPRGMPRANPRALLVDQSGRILKVEHAKLGDVRCSLVGESSTLLGRSLNALD